MGDVASKSVEQLGMYLQPGEFFAGRDYLDLLDGKIRLALGKTEAIIFDIAGWSSTQKPGWASLNGLALSRIKHLTRPKSHRRRSMLSKFADKGHLRIRSKSLPLVPAALHSMAPCLVGSLLNRPRWRLV